MHEAKRRKKNYYFLRLNKLPTIVVHIGISKPVTTGIAIAIIKDSSSLWTE
jgi:hypothetical protein